MLFVRARIKEMAEGKTIKQSALTELCSLLPCPRELCPLPLSPTKLSRSARSLKILIPPQAPSTLPLPKGDPKIPPASPTSHLWVLPLSAPTRSHGHPRAPRFHRADHGRRCRATAGAGGCPQGLPTSGRCQPAPFTATPARGLSG